MVLERQIPEFWPWVTEATVLWGIAMLILVVIVALISVLFIGLRVGPRQAMKSVLAVMRQTVKDVFGISPRKVMALALLTFKEAIRRKIVVGFIVFILIVLFAGMFLDPTSKHPLQLYVGFIFTTTGYLVLLLMLLLTAFSLPGDIQRKTIHTIVTKPVRISEIVLGRMVGFILMGTLLLAAMGVVSYGFVVRSQSHTHTLNLEDTKTLAGRVEDGVSPARSGVTSNVREHRHEVYIAPGGQAVTVEPRNDHSHEVTAVPQPDGTLRYVFSRPTEMFSSKIPQYGILRFRDEMGVDKRQGVNVGDEWEYRSFISGGTNARAIWLFDGVTPQHFADGLPVELTMEVFRTHKGLIDRRVLGSIVLRNPATGLAVETRMFESVEHATDSFVIPRKIKPLRRASVIVSVGAMPDGTLRQFPEEAARDYAGADKSEFDLFDDLVAPQYSIYRGNRELHMTGVVEIWVRCLEPGQYFGAAEADMYLLRGDSSFTLNFCKAYFGIWLQMVLIAAYGVMFSTFLSTPVTLFATMFVMLGGYFHWFLDTMGMGENLGGGPFEALIRMFTQESLTVELDLTTAEMIIANILDSVFQGFIWFICKLIPILNRFDFSDFVAKGYDIPVHYMLINFLYVLAFVFPLYVVAYLMLKTREVER